MRALIVVILCAAACGDNSDRTCAPPGELPPNDGPFADPFEIALPPTCVEAGLGALPGRWFVVDPVHQFRFEYPLFGGSCDDGFRREGAAPDDESFEDDGVIARTWSDGTHFWRRQVRRYIIDGQPYDYTSAFVACLLPDGSMAAYFLDHDPERGNRIDPAIGKRIGAKDSPASGLVKAGELGAWSGGRIVAFNLVVDGGLAYVVGPTGLEIIDVTDPAAPRHVGHYAGSFNDIRVVKTATAAVAYISPRSSSIDRTWMIDVTDPANPILAGVLPEYSHSVFLRTVGATTELYLATYNESVPRWDVTDPLVPVRVGMAIVPGEVAGVHDLFVDELDRIYANNTTSGLVVFDVSAGLDQVVELGRARIGYSHASWAGVVGGRRVILHGDEGMTGTDAGGAYLTVFDGEPTSPTFMQELSRYQSRPEVGIHNFEVHGDRVYIAYYQDGVRVVDLSTPTNPREVAHFNTWDSRTAYGGGFEGALGIRKLGGLLYVADSERGLIILRE